MPDRFGQGADYSQQFAYLYDSNLAKLERDAEEANDQREEDQAAKDKLVFDRYNAGKMGDQELLAYIRRRIGETGYDKTQQANWKEALLQYTESINDGRAAREFERTNDYAGYIGYLRAKVAGMKGNSAKKAELEKQISDLVAARDSGSVSKGADRILLQIQKGKATYKDLLAFYREQLQNTSDPQLRSQIRGQITEIAARVHTDNIENRIGTLDRLLADHKIDNQEYARRLTNIAQESGYKTTNSSRFNQLMNTATQIKNTVVDTGRLEEIDGKLMRGDITQTEAERLYYLEADRYKLTDPKTYNTIRNLGFEIGNRPVEPIPGQTPLPNPGVLGLPDNALGTNNRLGTATLDGRAVAAQGVAKIFKFISQIDGSEYGQVNCVYSASAMLAYAMGYRDENGALSGGDLRYMSGDRSIGTNLFEAEAVLGQLGITGLRNFNDKHVSFEAFKRKVGQKGMPAVLMGVNANLPDSLKAFAGAAKGHGVFVAAYDAKKDAFLWYDPAISKNQHPDYNGVWIDADVVKNFGWGPSYSDGTGSWSFSGQALFAPPNTIKGDFSANNVKRPPIKYVNVDDAPVRKQTPKNYRGYNHKGPSTVEPAGNKVVDRKGKPRAAENGKWFTDEGDRIDTVEEVQAELDKNGRKLELIGKLGEAKSQGKDSVVINGQKYLLNDELFKELDEQALDLFDRDILFADAAGLTNVINERSEQRLSFLTDVAQRNSIKADKIFNTAIRDAKRDFQIAVDDPDPEVAMNKAREIGARLRVLQTVLTIPNKTPTPLDDLSMDPEDEGSVPDLQATIELLDMVSDRESDIPLADRMGDILDLEARAGALPDQGDKIGNDLGNLVRAILDQTSVQASVDRGEAVPFIDGKTGKMGAAPMSPPEIDPLTGEEVSFPMFTNDDGEPMEGIQIPVQTPTGVKMRWVRPGRSLPIGQMLVWRNATDQGFGFTKDVPLTGAQLAALSPSDLARMLLPGGGLEPSPITVAVVKMPPRKVNGKLIPGESFFQDPGSGAWWAGDLPISDMGDRNMAYPQFIGMSEDLQPEIGWRPYATAGMVPSPYQGSRAAIQKAIDEGIITLNPTGSRGEDGNLSDDPLATSRFSSPFDPLTPRNQLGIPSLAEMRADDPDDRAERIEQNIKSIIDLSRRKQDEQNYANDLMSQPGMDPSTTEYPGQGGSGSFPRITDILRDAHRAGVIGMQNMPQNLPESAGPQPSRGDIPLPGAGGLSELGRQLGVNIPGTPMGPMGADGKPAALPDPRLKGPQGYTPPKPKTGKTTGNKSNLPRIGSVMVGGTRIDLPPVKRNDRRDKDDVYKPPPPPASQNSAKKPPPPSQSSTKLPTQTRTPTQNGMY